MRKGTVLIIEDNAANLELASDLLEYSGFTTIKAEDAQTGIQLAQTQKPDLILMDVHLPDIDGFQATRALKSSPKTVDIPVVAFTALIMQENQREATASGCAGVICKPINVDSFAASVAHYMTGPA